MSLSKDMFCAFCPGYEAWCNQGPAHRHNQKHLADPKECHHAHPERCWDRTTVEEEKGKNEDYFCFVARMAG